MVEIEKQIRMAARDAVNRKSRKPFHWAGLKGYEQLEVILQALDKLPADAKTSYLCRKAA